MMAIVCCIHRSNRFIGVVMSLLMTLDGFFLFRNLRSFFFLIFHTFTMRATNTKFFKVNKVI